MPFTLIISFVCVRIAFSALTNQTPKLDYNNQTTWAGTCQTGKQQSPTNLEVSNGICEKNLVFNLEISNTPVSFNADHNSNTINVLGLFTHLTATIMGGKVAGFDSVSFHFHSPSEHTINGKYYDLELHIVHQIKPEYKHLTTRTHAVLGVMFEATNSPAVNPLITAITESVNNKSTTTKTPSSLFSSFLNNSFPYYMYEGSLTTPNCDEIVNWYVMEKAVPISKNDLLFFTGKWKGNATFANSTAGNNRLINPINGRKIRKGGVVCEEKFVYFFSFLILYIFINYFIFKLL